MRRPGSEWSWFMLLGNSIKMCLLCALELCQTHSSLFLRSFAPRFGGGSISMGNSQASGTRSFAGKVSTVCWTHHWLSSSIPAQLSRIKASEFKEAMRQTLTCTSSSITSMVSKVAAQLESLSQYSWLVQSRCSQAIASTGTWSSFTRRAEF